MRSLWGIKLGPGDVETPAPVTVTMKPQLEKETSGKSSHVEEVRYGSHFCWDCGRWHRGVCPRIQRGVTYTTNDPMSAERARREGEWRLRREKLWGRK